MSLNTREHAIPMGEEIPQNCLLRWVDPDPPETGESISMSLNNINYNTNAVSRDCYMTFNNFYLGDQTDICQLRQIPDVQEVPQAPKMHTVCSTDNHQRPCYYPTERQKCICHCRADQVNDDVTSRSINSYLCVVVRLLQSNNHKLDTKYTTFT